MSSLKETTTHLNENEQHDSAIYFTNDYHDNNVVVNINSKDATIEWIDDDPYAFYDQMLNHNQEEEMYGYDEQEDQVQHQGEQTAYDYRQDALLHLVVGVQSYLSDLSCSGLSNDQDSPLNELQYKMYTYLKRRAHDMGVVNVTDHPVS
ncbi:hypothetical protein K492DRAFT_173485 [Lichtheimia hyalospora FSU 10163]|nr:hypothetical protein K492DRAFT_173485 [Lichtheimia hyalospora FSU 10163]